ncbi:MAG TPA: hypothetical protein VGO31_10210 [Microbacteriaceae bacterium]|nr:hypothetical protein [Microbacteriaceae bacterium]
MAVGIALLFRSADCVGDDGLHRHVGYGDVGYGAATFVVPTGAFLHRSRAVRRRFSRPA